MTALNYYNIGTVSIPLNGTVATFAGGTLLLSNAKPDDKLIVDGFYPVDVVNIIDDTHAAIDKWPGAAVVAGAYKIRQNGLNRYSDAEVSEAIVRQAEEQDADGYVIQVKSTETAPNPRKGRELQYAMQWSTGSWWQRLLGVWQPSGGPWKGYGGTSSTSLLIANTVTRVFATQMNLGYNGARVRAASLSGPTNYMEGPCTLVGNVLTMTVEAIGGAGTKADWVFSIAGQPGNMSGGNNLSEVTVRSTARSNIYAAPIDAISCSNIVINGDPVVAQAQGGVVGGKSAVLASGTDVYIADMWKVRMTKASGVLAVTAIVQDLASFGILPAVGGLQACVGIYTVTGAAMGTHDLVEIEQSIEGSRVARLDFGKSTSRNVTVGFMVYSPVAGVKSVVARNSANNRGYSATYTINAPNTLEWKTITIPGDIAGTWLTTTGIGFRLVFSVAAGSSVVIPPNVWTAGAPSGATGEPNACAVNGYVFVVSGVSLIVGNDVPAADRAGGIMRPFDQELLLCQRYFRSSWDYGVVPGTAWTAGFDQFKFANPTGAFSSTWAFSAMRAAGTMTIYDHTGASGVLTYFNGSAWTAGGAITTLLAKQNEAFLQHNIAGASYTNFGFKIDSRL